MKVNNLQEMIGGWFIGNFDPTLLRTDSFEIAIKRYKKGDYDSEHYHKIATEFTVVVEGEVEMSGNRYWKDDIITILPNESRDFRALTDVITVVVKFPGATNDKYLIDKK